ncbi:MAG: hypothetical protein FWE27_01060 [Defluviitaleaceae bacterium]|nr:hypothetical protein [Defluviitaleaceae bacterium]
MQNENEKLTIVKENILAKIGSLGESLAAKRTGVLDVRKEMWREARIVLRDFDDVADLTIFAEEVARHENQYVQASEEIKKLGKMLESPYFARIDFIEGNSETEQIYIGRHSLFDDETHVFHVYDWRAPISSLYYDYGTGAASFSVPGTGAVISGEITLKRQYQIEDGELLYLFDNDIAIEDDILRLELSKASEARIKTIINTIQADQNRAIRAEAGTLLVYGPAGCGKTSVGLHRLAYLLYRHRDSLNSSKVRIFSPNEIFSSYIAGIIPALGEEDVQTLDFHMLLNNAKKSRGGRAFRGQEQMLEAISENLDEIRIAWLKIKFSPEFLSEIEKYISSYTPVFEDVFFYNDKICSRDRLNSLYSDRTVSGTLASKTERVLSYTTQRYNEYFKANSRKITGLFNEIHDDNFPDGIIRAKFDEEQNISLADIRNRSFPFASKILEKCLKNVAKTHGIPFTPARDALRMDSFFFEDALLLFYIDLLTGRIAGEKTVKHILLDEAQDFSVLHHKILRKLYPASHFTVLADTNQALFPEININETEELCALYPQAQVIPLTKSYRSTYEIMRFAASLLGTSETDNDTQDPGIFLRNGREPVIEQSTNPAQMALEILGKLSSNYNTVGILLPTIGEAKVFHSQFKKLLPQGNTPRPLNLINAESQILPKGIMVMAASFAKGLEFDVVICPAFKQPQTLREQKLFYLICTRALHELFLIIKEA